jgi:abortive infection bacteriophage resistance protein
LQLSCSRHWSQAGRANRPAQDRKPTRPIRSQTWTSRSTTLRRPKRHKELEELSEDELKAIWREYYESSEKIGPKVYYSGIKDPDKVVELMNKLHTKNKYDIAKKYGLTIEQIDRLNVMGMTRWHDSVQ